MVKQNLVLKYKICILIIFPCNVGVRQGDNLSPLLFALFINDFSHYVGKSYKGLCVCKSCYPSLEHEDALFVKSFMLLYAGDKIVLTENERDLQTALDSLKEYCTKFKLIVNINKTKIIIFSRGKDRRFTTFTYGCKIIEVVSDCVCLGVKMNFNNTFAKSMKKQLDQGRRAHFSMLIKVMNLGLLIDILTKLFESIICPILLYGSEVCDLKMDMLEILYIIFFQNILKLSPSTPNCMIYGEVRKLPLQTSVDKPLIAYWLRVMNKDVHTFTYMVYMIALKLFRRDEYQSQWLKRVNYILYSCGLSYMWYQQQEIPTKQCKVIIHPRIEDIALQKWNTDFSTSSMCKMYIIFLT